MPPLAELPPITDERRLAVAQWVETNVRPVLHVVAEDAQAVEQPQQEFELRDYQVDAWANLDIAREEGRTRALGNLATGLGKTFVAGVDIVRYREWCASQDPPIRPRILYASHREDINDQAEAKTLRPLMPDATMTTFRTKRKNLPDADITYATLKALHSELDRFDPEYFDYIVWDEGHHLEAETYKKVRDHFRPRFAHVITATLERMDGKDIQEYTGAPLYQKTLPEGIAEGYLADVDYHIVFDDIVKQLIEEGFEPKTLKEFHELFNVRPRNEVIAKNIREEQHKIGLDAAKTMVFCESVKHAEEMAELLGGTAYHSDLEKDDRKRIMREFREGSTRVICTVDMFNEGIDIPDARLIVFLRSTQSGTIFEQQLGRGLRKMLGKDKVSVLDFVANIERIAKVRELSRSIQRRSEELGQKNGSEEGTIISGGEAEEPGLRIHTQHGDFDFDKIAVDLLARYNVLKPDVEQASAHIISVSDFALELGVSESTIYRIVKALELDLPLYKFGGSGKRVKGLDGAAQATIKSQLQELLTTPEAPEGSVTAYSFAQNLGMSKQGLASLLEKYKIQPPRYNFGGYVADGLTTDQQVKIRTFPEAVQRAPEGVISVNAFSKELGMAFSTLKAILERSSIALPQYKFGPKVAGGLDEAMRAQVRRLPDVQKLNTPTAPDGYVSIKVFARQTGIAKQRIGRYLDEQGIELPDYRFHSIIAGGLSPELQETLKRELEGRDGRRKS